MSNLCNSLYEYQVGGSLPIDAPSYVVRQADSDLYNGLKARKFCYVLNSRQMGKSSLRVRTMQRLEAEGIACAVIDFTTIGSLNITPEQWYAGVIDSISSNLNLYEKFDLASWWSENLLLSNLNRLSKFIEEIVLPSVSQNIVIFVDEIDSILSLKFNIDDFFAFIRNCYNKRADHPDYRRLAFALIGVATPSDLIQDRLRTPFNIGRAIELTGFQVQEARALAVGFAHQANNPQALLQEVLGWTGGQPFLTQKVCQLILSTESQIPTGSEDIWVEELVRSRLIEHWEYQDEPEHLKTIRNRLLKNEQSTARLLGLYQAILKKGELTASDSTAQMELRLTGLVVKQQGKLRVYNRIYREVFDRNWAEKILAKLRPYSESINAWLDSERQDESRLLRGQALQDAIKWKAGKSLSYEDVHFLDASQELEKREVQRALETERKERELAIAEATIAKEAEKIAKEAAQKANQLLGRAQKQAKLTIGIGLAILGTSLIGATFAGIWANNALKITRIEQAGATALQQFELAPIDALLSAMYSGQDLKALVKDDLTLEKYPTFSPLLALQKILANIREQNRINTYQRGVNSVSFSRDTKQLAMAGEDGTIQLWDINGKLLKAFPAHNKSVKSVRFSPNDKFLATASSDGTAKLWDANGKLLAKFQGHKGSVNNVRFSPNKQQIATSGDDGTVRLWNFQGKQLLKIKAHQKSINSLSFSPDGQQIATSAKDGIARVWNLKGKQLAEFKGHKGSVNSVGFSPDNKQLVTAGDDSMVRLWNLQGKQLQAFKAHDGSIESIRFSPNGQLLATSGKNGKVRLWNLKGNLVAEFNGHQGSVWSINFSLDGQQLATAGRDDGTVRLWKVPAKQPLAIKLRGHQGSVNTVRFSPYHSQIATAGDDSQVRFWDFNGKLLRQFKTDQSGIQSISFNPEKQQIVTAGHDGTVKLWELNGKLLSEGKGHRSKIRSVRFNPKGKQFATAGEDATVRLWNLEGKQLAKGNGHRGQIESLRFRPDGQQLATLGADGTVRLWDLNGKQLTQFNSKKGSVNGISFSQDGKEVAIAGDDGKVWRRALSGKLLAEFKTSQGSIKNISFSENGKQIATVGNHGTVRLWNLSGQLITEFKGHQDIVRSLNFSQNGKLLATAGEDGTAIIWRIRGLDELLTEGCDWLKDYFVTNPEELKKLEVCQKKSPLN